MPTINGERLSPQKGLSEDRLVSSKHYGLHIAQTVKALHEPTIFGNIKIAESRYPIAIAKRNVRFEVSTKSLGLVLLGQNFLHPL